MHSTLVLHKCVPQHKQFFKRASRRLTRLLLKDGARLLLKDGPRLLFKDGPRETDMIHLKRHDPFEKNARTLGPPSKKSRGASLDRPRKKYRVHPWAG